MCFQSTCPCSQVYHISLLQVQQTWLSISSIFIATGLTQILPTTGVDTSTATNHFEIVMGICAASLVVSTLFYAAGEVTAETTDEALLGQYDNEYSDFKIGASINRSAADPPISELVRRSIQVRGVSGFTTSCRQCTRICLTNSPSLDAVGRARPPAGLNTARTRFKIWKHNPWREGRSSIKVKIKILIFACMMHQYKNGLIPVNCRRYIVPIYVLFLSASSRFDPSVKHVLGLEFVVVVEHNSVTL